MPFRTLLAAAVGACLCLPALADDRRYNVEIVILENTDARTGGFEHWRPEVVVPAIEGATALDPPEGSEPMVRAGLLVDLPEGFEELPPEKRKLGGAIQKLQESGRYRVLRHLAWQQPALAEEEAPLIRIHHGEPITVHVPIENFDELDALEDHPGDASTSEGEAPTDAAGDERAGAGLGEDSAIRTFGADADLEARVQPLLRPVETHPLDGTIRLVVSRYLHVYTDLYFTTPVEWTELAETSRGTAAEAGAADAPGAEEADRSTGIDTTRIARDGEGRAILSHPFVQHRRMRSGELHYLDHPVLAMLIRVDRAEQDPADEDAASGTED